MNDPDNVIRFPIERTYLYQCHCGSPTRQDCYCFDRRPSRMRTWGLVGTLGGLTAFWVAVFRWIFGA